MTSSDEEDSFLPPARQTLEEILTEEFEHDKAYSTRLTENEMVAAIQQGIAWWQVPDPTLARDLEEYRLPDALRLLSSTDEAQIQLGRRALLLTYSLVKYNQPASEDAIEALPTTIITSYEGDL